MNIDLEKLAFENPNDFDLGGEVRKLSYEKSSDEDEWKENYLRLSADMNNLRKRFSKEKEELVIRTKTLMLEAILDIDSEIAIAASFVKNEGLDLIISKLEKFLNTQGVSAIQTSIFDENIHEVISIVESENKGIVSVVSKGYTIGDKIIRYPKVVISK